MPLTKWKCPYQCAKFANFVVDFLQRLLVKFTLCKLQILNYCLQLQSHLTSSPFCALDNFFNFVYFFKKRDDIDWKHVVGLFRILYLKVYLTHIKRNRRSQFWSDRRSISICVCLTDFLHLNVFAFSGGPFFFPGRCKFCKRFRTPISRCASSSSLFTSGWRALPGSASGRCSFLLFFLRPCARLLLLKHFELERYQNTRSLTQKLLRAKCKINQSSFWTSRAKPRHTVQLQPFPFLLPVFSAFLTRHFPWWSRWILWSRPPGV